jgi:autophagy-related protein 33
MEKRLKQRVIKDEVGDVNGEEVEKSARDQQWLEFVRTIIAGTGFAMGVVGIWGDGA